MYRSQSMDWSPNSLSPNTANFMLRKEKKIERLNVELRSEIDDKNLVIEENERLKSRIEEIQKQANSKRLENERLKGDMGDLEQQLETLRRVCVKNDKISVESTRLKEDVNILRRHKEDLEKDNERLAIALEKAEAKIGLQMDMIRALEETEKGMEIDTRNQSTILNELRKRCKDYELEIADLNEYNRALSDQLSNLESRKINTSLPSDHESLAHEVEFETMKERIAAMSSDIASIEEEQSKLVLERDNLSKEKADLEEQLTDVNAKFHEQLNELNQQVDALRNENNVTCLKSTQLERNFEQLSAANSSLKEQVERLSAESSNLKKLSEQLAGKNETLTEEIQKLFKKKQDLESTVTNVELEKMEHVKQNQELIEKLRTTLTENLTILDEVDGLKKQVDQYFEEKLVLETKVRLLQSEKTELETQCDEVNEKLTVAMEENLDLQKECESMSDEVEQLSVERLNLEAMVIDLKSAKIEFEKQSAKLNEELATLLTEKLTLQEEGRDLKERIKQLSEENLNLEAVVIDQKSERIELERQLLERFSAEKTNWETILRELDSEKAKLEQQADELNKDLTSAMHDNAALRETCQDLNAKTEQLSAAKLTLETSVNELNSQRTELETHVMKLNEQLTVSSNQIHAVLKDCEDLKEENEKLSAAKFTLETTASELITQQSELENQVTKLNEQLMVASDEIDTLLKDGKDLKEQVEHLSLENQKLETNVNELSSQRTELENQVTKLDEQLVVSSNQIHVVLKNCEDLKEENEKLSAAKFALETNVNELSSQRTELENQVTKLNEQLTVSSNRIQALLEDCEDLKEETGQLSAAKLSLETNVNELNSLQTELENQVTKLNGQLMVASDEIHTLLKDRKDLKEQVEHLSAEKQNLETIANESAAEKIRVEKELGEKLAALSEQHAALDKEVESKNKTIESLSQKKMHLELVIAELQSTIIEAERESERLNETLSNYSNANVELREESETLTKKVTELLEQKANFEELVRTLKFECEDFNQQVVSTRGENRLLVDENENLKLTLQNIESVIDECRHKVDSTVEEYNKALTEKQVLESNLLTLNQELYSVNRQLETALVENKSYEIIISDTKTALQEKTTDLDLVTFRCSEIQKERDGYESLLQTVEKELQDVEKVKNEQQKELIAARAFIDESSVENDRKCALLEERIKNLIDETQKDRAAFENSSTENEQLRARITELLEMNGRQSEMQDDFENLLKEKNAQLAEKEREVKSLLDKANAMSGENCSLEENLKQFREENAKLKNRTEELSKEKEGLYEIEKINNEAFQVQLDSASSKNTILSSENEKLAQLLKSLQRENDVVKEELDQVEKRLQCVERARIEELEKIVAQDEEERLQLNLRIRESHEKEEQLLQQVQRLNVKLVEETDRVNILQRTHSAELQKRAEKIKSLENKLARSEERITELKTKLEETVESNELLADDVKSRLADYEVLVKENENLLIKVDDLERIETDLRDACDRLQAEKEDLRREETALSLKVDSMNEALAAKEEVIARLHDEYEIFKAEYCKLVQHKDELGNEFKETLLQENKKLTSKCSELCEANVKMSEHICEKDKIIETLTTKIEDLETRADGSGVKETDLNATHVVASGCENELYLNLRRENLKMAEERDSYKRRQLELEAELEKEKENYRAKGLKLHDKIANSIREEYEGKLQRAKTEYQRKLSERFTAREQEWQKKMDEYKTMLSKEKEHNKDLNSQNWNIMDQYLRLKQVNEDRRGSSTFSDNFLSPSTLRKTKSANHLNLLSGRGMTLADSDRRMSSMSSLSGRASFMPETDRRLSTVSTISEDFAVPSKRKPSTISAKVFPTEDEEQEIFDNACLADLKHGRMGHEESHEFNKERMSILQARNSLCPPHLKSSYPAETQFLSTKELKEDEIKMGCPFDNDSEIETLSLGDRQRKPRNQITYKKPGPPTPSKNGGRSTVQVETPKNVLRESNENGSIRRRSFTPKFFNNLFALRGHVNIPTSGRDNDENMPLTPKHTRLASLKHRFSKH